MKKPKKFLVVNVTESDILEAERCRRSLGADFMAYIDCPLTIALERAHPIEGNIFDNSWSTASHYVSLLLDSGPLVYKLTRTAMTHNENFDKFLPVKPFRTVLTLCSYSNP